MMEIEMIEPEKQPAKLKNKKWISVGWILGLVFFIIVFLLYITPAVQQISFGKGEKIERDSVFLKEKKIQQKMNRLKTKVAALDRQLTGFLPRSAYIVVNTTKNRFYLYDRKGELIREGFCSSGSYTKLVSDKRTWLFKTPRGRLTILSKTENPVWAKPDWAFIEEGLPVPKAGDPSRFERGVLGDYALRMADGYLLHGTLYQRLLGMPVTHGCIRFGDEDLEVVYRTLPVGAYVYIY